MKKYPEEIASFIEINANGRSTYELTDMINAEFGTTLTRSQIRAYMKNHKIKNGVPCGLPAGRETELYPAAVREFIRSNFVGVGHQGMADLLNEKFGTSYTKGQMKAIYARFKLNSGRTGRFPKGHKPFKCIQKGWRISPETEFKAGHKPHNYRPIGTEVFRDDGYVWVKIADPNKWRQKHVLIWEAVNGPRPAKHVIIFGDGNRLNFDIDNLILASQAQLAVLNHKGLIQSSADLTRTGILIADVCSKIWQQEKKAKKPKRVRV